MNGEKGFGGLDASLRLEFLIIPMPFVILASTHNLFPRKKKQALYYGFQMS